MVTGFLVRAASWCTVGSQPGRQPPASDARTVAQRALLLSLPVDDTVGTAHKAAFTTVSEGFGETVVIRRQTHRHAMTSPQTSRTAAL